MAMINTKTTQFPISSGGFRLFANRAQSILGFQKLFVLIWGQSIPFKISSPDVTRIFAWSVSFHFALTRLAVMLMPIGCCIHAVKAFD
jgi:hypothetical protein